MMRAAWRLGLERIEIRSAHDVAAGKSFCRKLAARYELPHTIRGDPELSRDLSGVKEFAQ
jgi:hypothetical protein